MRFRIFAAATLGFFLVMSSTTAIAQDALSGSEAVRGKDTRKNTVKLGDRVFGVNADTVMRDGSGARIRLRQLDVPDLGRGAADPMLGVLVASYTAEQKGSKLILMTLDIQADPR
ncbi:MAG: hypothetical protein ACI9QQ_001073 [Myxococcota bacterium]|jgi:hypothetical protein